MTTAVYALIAPDHTAVYLSCAGHLPPLLVIPGELARPVPLSVDRPLGVGRSSAARRNTVLELPRARRWCSTPTGSSNAAGS